MSLRVVHATLAAVTAAAAFALIAAAAIAMARRSAYSVRLVLLVRRVAIIAASLAAAVGAALYIGARHRPGGLHLMYGALAVVVIPLAASISARHPRRGGLYHLFAGLLLLGFCFRLVSTS